MKVVAELSLWMTNLAASKTVPRCPRCHHDLDLHQPDENMPGRLLATCGSCAGWYLLMELKQDWSEVLVTELPGESIAELACPTETAADLKGDAVIGR